jgi:hypothetical protein
MSEPLVIIGNGLGAIMENKDAPPEPIYYCATGAEMPAFERAATARIRGISDDQPAQSDLPRDGCRQSVHRAFQLKVGE